MTINKGINTKDRDNALVLSYLSERGINKLIDTCDKLISTIEIPEGRVDYVIEIDTLEFSFVSNYTAQSEIDLLKLSLSIFDIGPISILISDNFRNNVGNTINEKVQLYPEDFNNYGLSIIGEYLESKGNGTLRYLQIKEYFNYIKQERGIKEVEKYTNYSIEKDIIKISSNIDE